MLFYIAIFIVLVALSHATHAGPNVKEGKIAWRATSRDSLLFLDSVTECSLHFLEKYLPDDPLIFPIICSNWHMHGYATRHPSGMITAHLSDGHIIEMESSKSHFKKYNYWILCDPEEVDSINEKLNRVFANLPDFFEAI